MPSFVSADRLNPHPDIGVSAQSLNNVQGAQSNFNYARLTIANMIETQMSAELELQTISHKRMAERSEAVFNAANAMAERSAKSLLRLSRSD